METNLNELKQIIDLYNDASNSLEDIKDKRDNSVLRGVEYGELSSHNLVFRNLKNFLASKLSSIMSDAKFTGFKEEDMMLKCDIEDEQNLFKSWERLAFDKSTNLKTAMQNEVYNEILNCKSSKNQKIPSPVPWLFKMKKNEFSESFEKTIEAGVKSEENEEIQEEADKTKEMETICETQSA